MTENRKLCVESMVSTLDREIRSRGHGAIRKLESKLGMKQSWWQGRVKRGDLTLGQLEAILEHLGLDPARYVEAHVEGSALLDLDTPSGPIPALISVAKERFENEELTGNLDSTFLDTLDRERSMDPAGVLSSAEVALRNVELRLLPRLCGILGSAHRLRLELEAAEHWMHLGLHQAVEAEDWACLGNLFRRYSYVLNEQTKTERALDAAEKGTSLLLRSGDRLGAAKGWVEQGIWLHYLGRHDEAICVLRWALEQLPNEAKSYHCSANHTLAFAYQAVGKVQDAVHYVGAAVEFSDDLGALDRAKIDWLRAKLQADLERFAEATATMRRVVEVLIDRHAGEAALAFCDLVSMQLRQGLFVEAHATARSTIALLEPLRKNPLVSNAIAKLLRASEKGLTLAVVDAVVDRIELERKDRIRWKQLRLAA